jgi:uncharacterized membrane protein YdfJ with MMPL/SSD domain
MTAAPKSPVSEVDEWSLPEEHDDIHTSALRKWYMPALVRYSHVFLLVWVVIFALSASFGLKFLSLTRDDSSPPANSLSAVAKAAFSVAFPGPSYVQPALIVQQSKQGSLFNSALSAIVAASFQSYKTDHSQTISSVVGYWELFSNAQSVALAGSTLSADNSSMLTIVNFSPSASSDSIKACVSELVTLSQSLSTGDFSVGVTGASALNADISSATVGGLEVIDGVVIPVSLLILGTQLKSYRHIFVALVVLLNTVLLAFGIMRPIATSIAINPLSPSILMSLGIVLKTLFFIISCIGSDIWSCFSGIAVCFDYSLFILSRFREERIENGKSRFDALFYSLRAAGHVVLLSGLTLFFCFCLLIAFPQNFIQSVGWSCSTVILSALVCNMTLTPALLAYFDSLSRFDLLPQCYCTRQAMQSESTAIELKVILASAQPSEAPAEPSAVLTTDPVVVADSVQSVVVSPEVVVGGFNSKSVESMNNASEAGIIGGQGLSIWFELSWFVTQHPKIIFLAILAFTAPFVYFTCLMTPTADQNLLFIRGSQSFRTLKTMNSAFAAGQLNPYTILCVTAASGTVLSPEYFAFESTLIAQLLASESAYINSRSITSITYLNGASIPLSIATQFFNSTSPLYATPDAGAYRITFASLVNADQSAAKITVATAVAPTSAAIVPFINDVRSSLTSITQLSHQAVAPWTLPVNLYLTGGFTSALDTQNTLDSLFIYEVLATIAVVMILIGLSFGSVLLMFRLLFTIGVSLCWTAGLCVLVYQPGPAQRAFGVLTPSVLDSSGIFFVIPPMAFSILVGLALDYDIFLISRVIEYRLLGWSDRAAVCLAMEKTSRIISTAGIIMSVSFAGLLVPDSLVLNQYGLSLFFGVAMDTFVIRTLVVPVVITMFGSGNWWPRRMPPVVIADPIVEEAALRAGCKVPSLVA